MRNSTTVFTRLLAAAAATFTPHAVAVPTRAPTTIRSLDTRTQFAGFGSTFSSADTLFVVAWGAFMVYIVSRRGSGGG